MNALPDMLMTSLYSSDILCRSLNLKVAYPLQGVSLPESYLGGDYKEQKRDGVDTIKVLPKVASPMYARG